MSTKIDLKVRYLQGDLFSTKDDLLQALAKDLSLTNQEFANLFIIEEYGPTKLQEKRDTPLSLFSSVTTIRFEQKFVVRLKTEEELNDIS